MWKKLLAGIVTDLKANTLFVNIYIAVIKVHPSTGIHGSWPIGSATEHVDVMPRVGGPRDPDHGYSDQCTAKQICFLLYSALSGAHCRTTLAARDSDPHSAYQERMARQKREDNFTGFQDTGKTH